MFQSRLLAVRWKPMSVFKTAHTRRCKSNKTTTSTTRPPKKTIDEKSTLEAPKALLVGSFAGVCGSLAGMGGGFVMIPLMTSPLLRLSQHQAHGTSLFAVTTTGIAGALGYSGQVNYEAAAAIACCGMITARLGAQATAVLSEAALRKALGVFMLCVAPMVPAKSYFLDSTNPGIGTSEQDRNDGSITKRFLLPGMIGCGSGFMAGLFGVGGGAIVVPALTLATDMSHYQALGTSLAAMVLPAMSGTLTHYRKGNVNLRVAPALAVGAFVGAYAGGNLGMTIEEDKLKWTFTALMFGLGTRTLLK